ncbi:MAG: prepilin-type N-terminal cleavage/methylation domain-containing protein, partial [Thermodesulfovibrionales bacterium]
MGGYTIQDSGFKIQDNYPVSCIMSRVSIHSSRINHRLEVTDHGFTLLEVLVALALLAIAIT